MGKIENTTKTANENPELVLAAAMLFGSSGSSERQESVGQAQLIESTDLPTDGSDNPVWGKMGITFGPPHADDPMFRPATLPPRWKKVATDHAMHSDLVDDKGRVRGGIFYKAAFYDRKAHLSPRRRFSVGYPQERDDDATYRRVLDCDKEVFRTTTVNVKGLSGPPYGAAVKSVEDSVNAWLAEHYPNWDDPSAYWD